MMIGSSAAQMSALMSGVWAVQGGSASGETKSYAEKLLKIVQSVGKDDWQSKLEMFKMASQIIDRHFKVLMAIAKNMGVSKEEREAAKQRLKELKKKREEFERLQKEERKDEAWEELLEFLEQMVDSADREAFERQRLVRG